MTLDLTQFHEIFFEESFEALDSMEAALLKLSAGEVDQALAQTMRLPGAANAGPWVSRARRYIAVHRALDEIESAALLTPANNIR